VGHCITARCLVAHEETKHQHTVEPWNVLQVQVQGNVLQVQVQGNVLQVQVQRNVDIPESSWKYPPVARPLFM
jgi:hypothetical protein